MEYIILGETWQTTVEDRNDSDRKDMLRDTRTLEQKLQSHTEICGSRWMLVMPVMLNFSYTCSRLGTRWLHAVWAQLKLKSPVFDLRIKHC